MKKAQTSATYFIVGFLAMASMTFMMRNSGASASTTQYDRQQDKLTFERRVTYQRAIEEIYWQPRIWSKENPTAKPPLEAVLPMSAIQTKVGDYLRQSQALETYWQRPITG